jgi:hypothetical protein
MPYKRFYEGEKLMELNYEQDIKIEVDALDLEWLEQAPLAMKYGRHLTHLKSIQRQLEERKKTVRSELILAVNRDAEALIGKKSPNAGDIEAFYRNHVRYKEVIEELNEAIAEAEFADVAYQQISWTRKTALENLVKLHGQQYFAGPSVPRDLSKEQQDRERTKRTDAGVAKALQRTKK